MKKIASVLSSVILCLCLTACGKSDNPQEIIGAVKTNLETSQSMDFDIHAVSDIILKYEDSKIGQKTEYKLNVKETSSDAYITGEILTSIGSSDNKYEVEAYQTSANENYSIYYKEDGNWYRQDTEEKKDFSMKLLKMFYDAGMTFSGETTNINEKECLKMEAEIYGESAQKFADLFGITTSETEKIGVTLYLYKDLNYPAYIKLDFKPFAKQMLANEELGITANNLYVELTFNSFNETDVSLPEDIKKDAKKKSKAEIQEQEKPEEIKPVEEPEVTAPESTEENSEFFDDEPEETIETISSDWNSFQFEYDEAVYRIPMPYKNFETSGFVMIEDEKTMIMEAGQSYTTTLYKGDYSVIVKIKNTTTSPKTLYECDIVSIDFDTYSLDLDQLAKFMFPNNINFAAKYENLVELWGEPADLHDGEALKIATYADGDNKVEIFFDPETNEIIEYKITAH